MRKVAAATFIVFSLLSGQPVVAQSQSDCQKYQCEQTVTPDGASEPYCAETFGGRWIECRVQRYCIQVVGDDGHLHTQCTPFNCEGETCFWV